MIKSIYRNHTQHTSKHPWLSVWIPECDSMIYESQIKQKSDNFEEICYFPYWKKKLLAEIDR